LKCGSVLEKAEETEEIEPQDKILTVSELSAWVGLNGAGGKVFEVTDWNKQLASTTRRRIMRILFGYEERRRRRRRMRRRRRRGRRGRRRRGIIIIIRRRRRRGSVFFSRLQC